MKWKFWQKNSTAQEDQKLSRPKDLPENVGRYLVVDLKMDPDIVWNYKVVSRRRKNDRHIQDIRIFNPASADIAGVSVRNFVTLDDYRALILFEGWLDTKTHQMEIVDKTMENAA